MFIDMRKIMIKKLLILFLCTIIYADNAYKLIGNPYERDYKNGEMSYARNIWDMQLYDGKIYLGAGNSSNEGPAQNAGRVYVVSLDPKRDTFSFEYEVAEEQIDLFKVYGDILYIPGHDATQKWDFGNIYRKFENRWYKSRTLPHALHVYDLVIKNDKVFTAIGLNNHGSVFISDKKAQSWEELSQGKGRVYSFLEVGDELFATKTFKPTDIRTLSVTEWLHKENKFSTRFDLNTLKIFPDTKFHKRNIKIIKPLKFDENSTFYIGAYQYNDHQNLPFGFYKLELHNKMLKSSKILLPKNSTPRDSIKRENNLYILTNTNTHVEVFKASKENNFTLHKIISFKYPTFARSFEELNGCFYFGMGSEIKNPKSWKLSELKKETGDILKVCVEK